MRNASDEIPKDFPIRVRSVRGRLELTQVQLAERIGVSFATVNRWENRQSKPTRLAWQQILDLEAEIAPSEGSGELAPVRTKARPTPDVIESARVRVSSPILAEDRSREIAAAVQARLAQLLGSSPAVIYCFEANGTW